MSGEREMHYKDCGVAGGWPHPASDCEQPYVWPAPKYDANRLTLGIDPGKTGAIAILDGRRIIDIEDMPELTGAALGSWMRDLFADLAPHTVSVAWVEKVGAMPKQGVASTWKFAEGYGALLGALGACGVPVRLVTPAVWKKRAGLSKDKSASRQRACELWPDEAHRFARVKDDGRAESALVALHGVEER